LVRVTLITGEESWIYIHVEVQGQHDASFAQRMFTYNYRLYDRYARPIASLAVLADEEEGWKPSHYGFEALGCTHELYFPVVKLLEPPTCVRPVCRAGLDDAPARCAGANAVARYRTDRRRDPHEIRHQR
ncbi:MAG: hypothetical protein Q8M04_02745, partial [Pseudomonadota bacterium]|nr:hypothetical protein [Pseudomonadota bacterium]